MASNKFRAIIIGGGPVGLTIANGLERAGLDFLIIERHPTFISESGAGIMLWPHTVRVFDQLGLLEACEGRYIPLHDKTLIHLDGTPVRNGAIFKYLSDKRVAFNDICHYFHTNSSVVTATHIRAGVGIENIEMTKNGVQVHLSDGSVEEGSIVVGADGIHSRTRCIMQELAKKTGNDIAKDEDPIVANYQILYGRAKYVPNAEIGTFYETHSTYRSSQISADGKRMHFGIYRKLPNPTTELRKEYTEEEVAEFVEAFSDVMVMPKLSFPELYKNCEWTKLQNQHEGLAKHWYYGRIVLAGDSCVQMTAAAGMGVNNGLQSAVVLVNKLYEALSNSPNPDTETLERVFEEYQNARREESLLICQIAARMIRVNTWDSYLTWFMGDVVFPWMLPEEKLMTKVGMEIVRGMQKFDFIKTDLKSGKIPWTSL
ncbi:hypothetical protein NUW58_g6182 [Xylaria curta]|uniref:Uncharacterized protein n=1 Tax=Xylaria curta TaxID=42375 RepID=A0ACC1NY58_9PEZI|nr:hypothetical protein NUW58_g6182 [Xylaria curta]